MTKIALQAASGQYVCAEGGGGQKLFANRDAIGPWETFTLTDLGDGKVALQAANDEYVCAEGGGGQLVVANRKDRGPWETFTLIDLGDNKVALQAANGQYVCAIAGGGQDLIANRDALGPWETFTKKSLEEITPSILSAHHWTFAEVTDSVTIDLVSKASAQLFNVKPGGQGRIGPAIAVNGSDDSYLSFGREIGQFGQADFTVAFGVKIAKTSKRIELLGNRTTEGHGSFFCIRVTPTGQIVVEVDEDTRGTNYIGFESVPGLDDNIWHHITVVRQKNELRLYIDGNLSGKKPASGVADIENSNDFRTGSANPALKDAVAPPKADFEDLRIYDRALSDIQISALVPPLKEGEIELKTKDGIYRTWNKDVADFGSIATNFEKLRLGLNTGVTLYKDINFSNTFQELVADSPDLSQTRIATPPRSARIWSTVGKAFTGKWVILAPNNQYLVVYPPLTTSPGISDRSLFDFHFNLERQWTQILPSLLFAGKQRILEIPINSGLSQSLICQPEDSLYRFSLVNERQDRWLRFVPNNRFAVRTLSGKYIGAEDGGGGGVFAKGDYPLADEFFELVSLENNRVALKTLRKGLYVAAVDGGGGDVIAKVSKLDVWETFILEKLEENRIALKTAAKGLYVCAENGGGTKLVANRSQRGPWETFELCNLGGFDWTANRDERAIFTRAIKMAEDENQMGELLPGEVALYENYGYWGKTLVLYNSCSDFRVLGGLNFNETTSSIRLGPATGATLYAGINYSEGSTDRKNDITDIVENVPNLGESQIGNDNLSSIKIWSSISPKQANVTFSISMSQDYRMKGDELEEFSSYRTILKFLPEVTEVEVWATDLTKFEIDETTYEVDEDRSVTLSPNEMNRLMITSEAEGINTPGLKIRTNMMESHERVVIFPDREVHRQLTNLKEGELWEAKDAQGNPLVDRSAYNADQVADVQRTISKTMATVSYVAAGSEDSKYLVDREISADAIDKPWQLSFATTAPVQEQVLSQSQFEELERQASTPLAQDWKGFLRQIKQGVKTAVSVAVGVVNKVVQVIVTAAETVVDAVGKAIQKSVAWVIDTAEKAGAFIEGVVEKIGVKAKQFVEFLRNLFDWGEILDTQRYLADAIDVGLGYAVKLADRAREPVANFMTELRQTVGSAIATAINQVGGNQSDLHQSERKLPEQLEWLLSKLTGGAKKEKAIVFSPESLSNSSSTQSNEWEKNLLSLFETFELMGQTVIQGFTGFAEAIATLIQNPLRPQLALIVVLRTFKDVIDNILQTAAQFVDLFLRMISAAIGKFQSLIKAEIKISFIQKLFKLIGVEQLNLLNLASLVLAIPVTITSKLRFGRAPFQESPKLALSTASAQNSRKLLSENWGRVGAFGDVISGTMAIFLDAFPEEVDVGPPGDLMESISLISSIVAWLSSFPSSGDESDEANYYPGGYPYDFGTDPVNGIQRMEWTLWGWRSFMLGCDVVGAVAPMFPSLSKFFPERRVGRIERFKRLVPSTIVINTVFSVVELGLSIAYSTVVREQERKDKELAVEGVVESVFDGISTLPGIFGFLRMKGFNTPDSTMFLLFVDAIAVTTGYMSSQLD